MKPVSPYVSDFSSSSSSSPPSCLTLARVYVCPFLLNMSVCTYIYIYVYIRNGVFREISSSTVDLSISKKSAGKKT